MAILSKKEMTIGEILTTAWRLFWDNVKTISLIVLVVYIPLNILLGLSAWYLIPEEGSNVLEGFGMFMRVNTVLELVIGIIGTMAIAWLVKSRIDKKKVGFQEAVGKAVSRWPAAFITSLIMGILVGLLLICFIVPGVMFTIFWFFAIYVVLFEDKMLFGALKESKAIVRGRWWKTFGFALVFGILSFLVSLFAGIPGMILSFIPNEAIVAMLGVFTDTFIDLAVSFFTVVSTIFYLNMRDTKLEPRTK